MEARKLVGDELQLVQFGGAPKDAKPFKGIGSGVFEIAVAYDKNAYRAVYAVQLGRNIYILHAFQKKSRSGIKTSQKDADLIRQRYKQAKELANVKKQKRKEIQFENGSGNVFADLEITDADEFYARARLGFGVYRILQGRDLKQREIGELLGISQPEVSHLMNGHFSRFTTDKLLDFLKRLDRKVTIRVGPHKPGEPFQVIGFAS